MAQIFLCATDWTYLTAESIPSVPAASEERETKGNMLGFLTMQVARLDSIQKIEIEPGVVSTTLSVLRLFGAQGCEGLVLWIGEVGEGYARITRAVVPDQRPIRNEEGVGYFVGSETLFELNRRLSESGLRLIAQVHSHPSEAYHSAADDRYAIVTADGGLSLVVPDFGEAPSDPTQWAVYRLSKGAWRELDSEETHALLKVEASA
jgi:hypothetical protein